MNMNITSLKVFLIAMASLLATGCATRSLYDWGGYDTMLYRSYKSPEKAEELRTELELHITKMELSQKQVAPGLYAELGTFYLQAGDSEKAVGFYARERDAWPESRGLMDAMIVNVSKRGRASKAEVKP